MGGGEARYTRDYARAYATFAFGQIHPNRDQRIIVETKISALNYVYNRHTAAHGTRKFDVNDDIWYSFIIKWIVYIQFGCENPGWKMLKKEECDRGGEKEIKVDRVLKFFCS